MMEWICVECGAEAELRPWLDWEGIALCDEHARELDPRRPAILRLEPGRAA